MISSIQTKHDASDVARLGRVILASPILEPIVRKWEKVSLPDCWLVAGAIAQTVWNDAFGFDPDHGVVDVDLVYFDGADLSEDTEAEHASRIRSLYSDCGVKIDVKNEARVHLWYSQRFGYGIPPYTSTEHAIRTFPTTATAIGVQPECPGGLLISAPFGLSDLFGTIVRPNRVQVTRSIYAAKVIRWRSLWPELKIVDWSDVPD